MCANRQVTGVYLHQLAPNEYAAIGFDDFVLFARVTEQIGL